jgi:spermidine synthase
VNPQLPEVPRSPLGWLWQPPRPIPTTHNGTMWLSRRLGTWRLFGLDGSDQATPYMDRLWSTTLRRIGGSPAVSVQRALILGVALGATPALVRRRWPDAEVVAVDCEPSLFALGRALGIHDIAPDDPRTRFVAGDAAQVVPGLAQRFDLVLVDLFRGRHLAPAATAPVLIGGVADRLTPGGVAAVNVFSQPAALEAWRPRFARASVTRCEVNLVGLFEEPLPPRPN